MLVSHYNYIPSPRISFQTTINYYITNMSISYTLLYHRHFYITNLNLSHAYLYLMPFHTTYPSIVHTFLCHIPFYKLLSKAQFSHSSQIYGSERYRTQTTTAPLLTQQIKQQPTYIHANLVHHHAT